MLPRALIYPFFGFSSRQSFRKRGSSIMRRTTAGYPPRRAGCG